MTLIFVSLCRFRKKPTKEMLAELQNLIAEATKKGSNFLSIYWTLGRYDMVVTVEAPDEKAAMACALTFSEYISTETMTAVSNEEAGQLIA
jgi:uncharacterized protein with GYD domain